LLRKKRDEPPCGPKVSDKRIAFVLDVEFEAFRHEHCGASHGCVFLLANRRAECLSKKMPPTRPSASREIQNPSLFRPTKNSGITSLMMLGSGRCGNLAAAMGDAGCHV
jgi:hypothetical protein